MKILILMLFVFVAVPAQSSTEFSVEEQSSAIVMIYAEDGGAPDYLGLGFMVKPDGTFATNNHLVDGRKDLTVKLMDGDVYSEISLVDRTPLRDLAILKFGGFDMNVVNLGNSKNMNIGDKIYVLDVDENLEYGINEGEILDTGSNETGFKYFEISVKMTPASNGSAVFNGNGEVIGIANSMKVGEEKLNIAMPINYVRGMNLDAKPVSLSEEGEGGVPVFGNGKPVDNSAVIRQLNAFVSTCYAKFNQLMDVADQAGWFYRFKENRVVERHPIIFQVADRLKELTRDASKFRKESPMDEDLGKIFDEYGYLFAKMANNAGLMVSSQHTDAMDYANVSAKNIMNHDMPEANKSFREYVVKNYPDLESNLMLVISQGPRPYNPNAAYGMQVDDNENGVVVTEGDGKYFHVGDILLGVAGGVDFGHSYDFMRYISVLEPGAPVNYRIGRDGRTEVIETVISKR